MEPKKIACVGVAGLLALGLVLIALQYGAGVPDPKRAPGAAVGHVPAPSPLERILGKAQYLSSPSIAIHPDGFYVASHDLFGWGSSQNTSGISKVYRSTDRGATWKHAATLEGQFWSNVFVHRGGLYIFGYAHRGGNIIIRKSMDGGYTWTYPSDENNGLLKSGRFGGTPNRPVVHEGRLWIAQGTRLMSAPVDADLLKAASWTRGKTVRQDPSWLGGRFTFWSEGQVTASPAEGVVILPKVNQLPYTALLRAGSLRSLHFDADLDFVDLPGAEKKFGAAYDAVSEKYYVCNNPVLFAHRNDWWLRKKPAMIRNTAALLSSKDLRHWQVEKIFLYSPDLHHEAFQYLNFEFDGDDLAVISRTAFVIGGHKPPRGHDSNLMTFHRIPDFRNASPDHVLEIDRAGKRVLRFERTQYRRAPLGAFPLGSEFDGTPLRNPAGLAQDADGKVYIREQSGRVLQFDAAGNFLRVAVSAPVSFVDHSLAVEQPVAGERSWTGLDSNSWQEPVNWYYWGRPDTPEELAIFGSAAAAAATITLDTLFHIKGMRFQNTAGYTIDGCGELSVGSAASAGLFEVTRGWHTIKVPITLGALTRVHIEAGAALSFDGPLDLNGETLIVSGTGFLTLSGPFSMGNGRLVLDTWSPVALSDPANALLDGTLELRLPEGASPPANCNFELFSFLPSLGRTFDKVELPALADGLAWDTPSSIRSVASR